MQQKKISRKLSNRLGPLALVVLVIISFFIPVLYSTHEIKKLQVRACVYAEQLAIQLRKMVATSPKLWKYQTTKYSEILESFDAHRDISSIEITDEKGIPINQFGIQHTDETSNILLSISVSGRPAQRYSRLFQDRGKPAAV